jgi:hypothetical protein
MAEAEEIEAGLQATESNIMLGIANEMLTRKTHRYRNCYHEFCF